LKRAASSVQRNCVALTGCMASNEAAHDTGGNCEQVRSQSDALNVMSGSRGMIMQQ